MTLRSVGATRGVLEPSPAVVKSLEEALALAKSGELVAVGLAVVYADGATATMWAGGKTPMLLGALSHLAWRMNRAWDDL